LVLAVGLMMRTTDIRAKLPHEVMEPWVERGGSSIIGPDATYVVEPVYDREQLIIADLDLSMIDRECMSLDVSGHYVRPDVFSFSHRTIKKAGLNIAPHYSLNKWVAWVIDPPARIAAATIAASVSIASFAPA
jgi:hypothetical protein